MIDISNLPFLKGKKVLVTGIANEQSIAYGCAKAFRAFGAELAITYRNDKAKTFVEPLAKELDASLLLPLDLQTDGQLEAIFEQIDDSNGASSTSACIRSPSLRRLTCKAALSTARRRAF